MPPGRAPQTGQGPADDGSTELVEDLQVLVDWDAEPTARSIDIDTASTIDQALHQVAEFFRAEPGQAAVSLMVGDALAGVATRRSLKRAGGTAGGSSDPYELGAGDRIQLPGQSVRYRLLTFACSACSELAYRIYYDLRDLPACAHGNMELRQ